MRLYLVDSYLATCDTSIVDIDNGWWLRSDTVFYPGGGGGPTDFRFHRHRSRVTGTTGSDSNPQRPAANRGGKVRIVEIGSLDAQACGGTHVHSTGEIRRARIDRFENKGRHNKRLH